MAARCNQSPRVSQPNRFLARPNGRRNRKQKKSDEGEEDYRELFPQDNFYSLLEKSKLVSELIQLYEHKLFNSPSKTPDFEWQTLVEQTLPDWLFWITEILTTHAKLVAQHQPMSRAQLRELIDYRLLGQANKELRLKCGPNSLWTRHTLRRAINHALPDITTPGAVTLANLAKKINQRSDELFGGRDITLKGKHLQKLLKQNHIDWIEIKRVYKDRLIMRDPYWWAAVL